jgi:hypothetical protein
MKNEILIDVDTDRATVIQFKKPEELIPKSQDEINSTYIVDVNTLFEAFCQFALIGSASGVLNKNEVFKIAIDHLTTLMDDNKSEEDSGTEK